MKKFFFVFGIINLVLKGAAQYQGALPKHHLQLNAGRSKHGTGDIAGISFSTVYSNYFKKHLAWVADVGGTIHDDSEPLFFSAPNGQVIDGSIRSATAGLQSTFGISYIPIRTYRHELQLRISALFRYQSSSLPDTYSILYPAATGLPIPVIYFENTSRQRTFAIGGFGSFGYNYTATNLFSIGILAGLQTDTNGDTVWQLSLNLGKRF